MPLREWPAVLVGAAQEVGRCRLATTTATTTRLGPLICAVVRLLVATRSRRAVLLLARSVVLLDAAEEAKSSRLTTAGMLPLIHAVILFLAMTSRSKLDMFRSRRLAAMAAVMTCLASL
jgi:hypothetical protein